MEKVNKALKIGLILAIGFAGGCFAMYYSHKDMYNHAITCQEKQLMKSFENVSGRAHGVLQRYFRIGNETVN